MAESPIVVGVLGLGEAGSCMVADLLAAGAVVRAYDPAVPAPAGTVAATDEADAASGAGLVLSLTTTADSMTAAANAAPGVADGAVWAEASSSSPEHKKRIAGLLPDRSLVADLALMSTVPGQGIRVPMTASGPGAAPLQELLAPLGARVEVIDGPIGAAAARKLLRSVFFKGLAAAVVESLVAAQAVGLEAPTYAEIARELDRADATTVERLVSGSLRHAVRRADEMAAAAEMLDSLDVPPRVSSASRQWLEQLTDPEMRAILLTIMSTDR